MMKQISRLLTIALCLMVFVGFSGSILASQAYAADDEEYTFTVTVYSGKEGYFNDEGTHIVQYKDLKYGDEITLNINDLGLQLLDGDKYYARGLKIAGHDNNEVKIRNYQSYTFKVTGDESFSVAYGMKGGMVRYLVRYVDQAGNELYPEQEYYGMVGDYPVVSYQYVEGYLPDAYNKGKTIQEDESENVFTFTYSRVSTAGGGEQGGNGGNAGNGGNQPANFIDIDDTQPPTTTPDDNGGNNGNGGNGGNSGNGGSGSGTTDIVDNPTPTSGFAVPIAIGGIAGVLALALLIILLVGRRKNNEAHASDEARK